MNTAIRMAALGVAVTLAMTSAAHAALQARDLDGNLSSFEAYYDTVLDLTWLANTNQGAGSNYDDGSSTTDGRMTWASANSWAANLSFYNPVTNKTLADWRLPTVDPVNGVSFNYTYTSNGSTDGGYNITSPNSEMAYMFYVNLGNPGYYTPAGAVSGCYVSYPSNTCLDNVGPFSNLQPDVYWSGSEYAPVPGSAWYFDMNYGYQDAYGKYGDFYAWAVSPGDVAAVPEAETYALMLAGLGLVGWRARRRG